MIPYGVLSERSWLATQTQPEVLLIWIFKVGGGKACLGTESKRMFGIVAPGSTQTGMK